MNACCKPNTVPTCYVQRSTDFYRGPEGRCYCPHVADEQTEALGVQQSLATEQAGGRVRV